MRLAVAAALAALTLASPALAPSPSRRDRRRSASSGTGEAELKPDFARIHRDRRRPQGDDGRPGGRRRTTRHPSGSSPASRRSASSATISAPQNFQVFQTPQQVGRTGKEVEDAEVHSAHHRLQITTRDLDGVGRLAGEILASGDMTFQSVSFGLDRQEEGGDKARDARPCAMPAVRPRSMQRRRESAWAVSSRSATARPSPSSRSRTCACPWRWPRRAESAPIVPPATIRYTANVQLVWEIAPKP